MAFGANLGPSRAQASSTATRMNTSTPLPNSRIVVAFLVAGSADALQLLLTALSLTGVLTVPVEVIDFALDVVVCALLSVLLGGFHWILAPAFLAETLPVVELLPTWTATVAALVWIRRKQARAVVGSEPRGTVEVVRVETMPRSLGHEEGA